MHVMLSEVDVQLVPDIARQTAAWRVAAHLEYRCPSWQEGSAAVDQRKAAAPVIVYCGQRAPDSGDYRTELRRVDRHSRNEPGDVLPAMELQKVNPVDIDHAAVR